jgi:PPP family 3-phenylpropionic acid transporter
LSEGLPTEGEGPRGRALPLLAAAYFLSFASVGLQVPFAAPALLGLGLGAAAVGRMWATRSALQVLAPTLWGSLADRFGDARPFTAAALAGGAAALFALVFVEGELSGQLAFAAYGLLGTATASLLDGLTLTALGREKRRYGQVRLFGAAGFGAAAGLSAAAVELSWLEPTAARVFPLAAGLHVLAAGCVLLLPRLPRPRLARLSELRGVFAKAGLFGLGLASLLHWASHGAYTAFISPLVFARGGGPGHVGVALAAGIVLEVFVMRASPKLLERFGASRLLGVAVAFGAVRWLAVGLIPGVTSLVALQGLHGVTFGLFYPAAVALLGERLPERARQSGQGLFASLFFGLGGALGMSVSGWTLEAYGERATWIAMGALSLSSLGVLAVAAVATRRRP